MKRDKNHLSELTHLIYNASLHPEQWVDAVTQIHASMGANKSILFTPFVGPQHGGIAFPVGFTQAHLELWATKFVDKDIFGKRMQQKDLFFTGSICTDRDIFPTPKEYQGFLDSPISREYSSITNLQHCCVGVVFEGSPDLPAAVYSAWRSVEQPAFTREDKEWMGLLISHISRAMGIMMRLDTAKLQKATLGATLDRMKFGVALLNDELQVIHLNRAAQAVLDRDDGISLNDNRVLDSRSTDTRVQVSPQGDVANKGKEQSHTLASWLADYKKMPVHEQQHFLQGATVIRKIGIRNLENKPSRRRQYLLQCAPLPDSELLYSNNESARYAVFITDPQAVQLPSIEKLVAIYGLTETEAKIALEFVDQGNYRDVAQRLQITENTIRWHIKNIYPKLSIYKLGDLVRMVMALGESGV